MDERPLTLAERFIVDEQPLVDAVNRRIAAWSDAWEQAMRLTEELSMPPIQLIYRGPGHRLRRPDGFVPRGGKFVVGSREEALQLITQPGLRIEPVDPSQLEEAGAGGSPDSSSGGAPDSAGTDAGKPDGDTSAQTTSGRTRGRTS